MSKDEASPSVRDESPAGGLLRRAKAGDASAFDQLLAHHRCRLYAHCYRMLGSPFDADDALQETLLAAWRGLASFEGRSALGTWLYSIATRVCLRALSKRPRRITAIDHALPLRSTAELGEPVSDRHWLEPVPDDEVLDGDDLDGVPETRMLRREQVSLAFVALLQHLPGMQRAVMLLREVLDYSAAETAEMLGTSVVAVNSALQRARRTMRTKAPDRERSVSLPGPDEDRIDQLLSRFSAAWESRDIEAMVALLTDDVRFTMPPLPAWFQGRNDVQLFFTTRVFETAWRLLPVRGNGQPGFACYLQPDGDDRFRRAGLVLLRVDGDHIAAIDSFLDPRLCRRFGMVDALL